MKNKELWTKLEAFKLDDLRSHFTFSQRLARDNKWSHQFSLRVIDEYKKFIYLCCVGYGEITPSDAVDQAWHLHLTFTRSYWVDMCGDTLGVQIHHNPTKGGKSEKRRYSNDYDNLQDAYLKEFKQYAPRDIWPTNQARFSNINFKRINLSDYWLIRKPNLAKPKVLLFLLPLVAMLFIQASDFNLWNFIVTILILVLFAFLLFNAGGNGRGGSDSDGGGSWWGGSGGDDSGCSNDGCSSGCSGCSGGGE